MANVVFFIGSLKLGGTEAKLARNFLPLLKSRGKITPKLLLLQDGGEFVDTLPRDLEKMSLEETADTNLIRIIPRFKRAISELRADVAISCMWYPAIIADLARKTGCTRCRHIVHDTVNMTEYVKDQFTDEKYKFLKLYLTRMAYRDADGMIVVSRGEKEDLVKNFGIPPGKIRVIYNPVNSEMIEKLSEEDSGHKIDAPLIVSAGRLVHQKGFDVLIRAFRRVRNHIPAKLLILGEGEKRDELTALVRSLELESDVVLSGMEKNPFRLIKNASVFCLASRYEGLGNVILEAMTLGVPVVVTDCPSGPSEIVDGGRYGILVRPEDPEAIAESLLKILTDGELRKTLSELSLKRARDFSLEQSLGKWEDVISGL